MNAHPKLIAHSDEFQKDVVELCPGVYTAVGYAASTQHMIEGDDGLIIIDTSESTKAAENVLAAFREISDKPIKTIIYTHSHRDHISGAAVFCEGQEVEIIASHDFESDLMAVEQNHPAPHAVMMARTKRQFGISLSFPDERVNLGCGPGDRPMEGMGAGFIAPNLSISEDRVQITRLGVTLDLIKAPGETPDHMIVWLADRKVLICGDNYYKSFPNLYAIRGTAYRDFNAWADTLDMLIGLQADVLAPGHSRPVFGADNIRAVLTDYRDAIQYVVAETAKGMNAGLGPDELAHRVTLPAELAEKPHLQEFYGKVSWAVRAYFAGTLGWFDGNATNLGRLSPKDEATRIIKLAGGADAVVAAARQAAKANDPQWVLELADRLLASGHHTDDARTLKVAAMRVLAETEINATARNYYLLSAKELQAET